MTDAQLLDALESRFMALQILCIAMAIFLIGILILFGIFLASNKKHQKELLELGRYSTNVQAIIDNGIPDLLEAIIADSFNDYNVMVLAPRQELYITEEREAEIRKDLTEKVAMRLSPMSVDKLSLFYNIHNLDGVLADKIYITVTNYVVQHNDIIRANESTKPNGTPRAVAAN